MAFDRGAAVWLAKVADEAQDYDEMVEQVTKLAKNVAQLTVKERKLLQAGYDKLIKRKRDSWATILTLESKELLQCGNDMVNAARINAYKKKIGLEIIRLCAQMLSLLHDYLIPLSTTSDASVYYYTMKGDYYRYRAEFKYGTDREDDANLALQTYENAMGIAEAELPRAHPARLGSALNLALFHHEFRRDAKRAFDVTHQALGNGVPGISNLSTVEEIMESLHLVNQLIDRKIACILSRLHIG